ncbi:hypothetical protein PINS_up002286 [Pythium insidiosum]|nr:hypothetical protein PINS_up002286 [Pythium insidiosum]
MTAIMSTPSSSSCARCDHLEQRIAVMEAENSRLRALLRSDAQAPQDVSTAPAVAPCQAPDYEAFSPLHRDELERFGRQMLVPDFRVSRQLRLRSARVLIVGAGGLGCPVALYLGAMGVGRLGIADDDRVERSNLHRQIGHSEQTIGQHKALSLAERVRGLNPRVVVDTHVTRVSAQNVKKLVEDYDVVVDASDNPATRYLLNDVCAMKCLPLVSGSALGLEGQVTVFPFDGASPCYRCLYPKPAANPQSCEENGVLGVVPGVIGVLQALETVRVITELGAPTIGTQLHFDAFDSQFRRLKLATKRRPDCPSCGIAPMQTVKMIMITPCSISAAEPLAASHRMSIHEWATQRRHLQSYALLDTRTTQQFEMVHFPEAINTPFETLQRMRRKQQLRQYVKTQLRERDLGDDDNTSNPLSIFVICRRGVDSVTVSNWLLQEGFKHIVNVDGGYTQYARDVDPHFPMY